MERKWWTLLVACLATFMLLLDITVVNVALPDIQSSLHASFSDLQWVVDAYALTLAALLLTAGSLGDRMGRKLVFAVGLGLFVAASLLCGLATTPTFLNLARALQGVGGAVMFAQSLALIAEDFHGRERGTAFGIWGATLGAAVAIGPLVGGILTEAFGWEWIFFVNIPIGIATIALTLRFVHESRGDAARRLDLPGTFLFSGALFALVFALIRGNAEGWGSALIVGLLLGSVLLLVLFVVVERRVSDPMFDLSLFRVPAFCGVSIAAFALSASMFAMFLYLTLYVQNILGFSPLASGLRFLPITLVSFFVAPIAGQLTSRVPVRNLLGAGLLLVSLGLLLMHGVKPDSSWTTLLPGFLLAGVGIGLCNPAIATVAVGVVAPAQSGMASGISSTFRQVGIATGIAGLGAIFQSRVQDEAARLLAGTPGINPTGVGHQVATGETQNAISIAPPSVRGRIASAASDAFCSGFNRIVLIAAAVAFVGAVLSFVLTRQRDLVAQGQPAQPPAGAQVAA